jgi:MFS family permease
MSMSRQADAARSGGWYHGWNIVAALVLSQIAANGLAINSMSLFLDKWAKDLNSPISQLLLAMLPLALVASLAAPLVGVLADKYPARWLLGIGLAGITVFCLAVSAINATWQLWVLYGAIFPISLCLCTSVTANAVVSRWFVRRVGLALGLTAFGVGLAGAILSPIIAAAMPAIGWRGVWLAGGLMIGFVVLPLVVWVVRDRPCERDGFLYLTGAETRRLHHGHGAGGDLRWLDIARRKNFWLIVACFLPMLALYGGIQQNLAPIAASHGLAPETAGLLLSIFSVSHVVSTVLMGMASDRFGNRLPLAGLSAGAAAGGILVGYGGSLPVLIAGVFLIGVSGGIWTLLPAAMGAEFGADRVGRAFGALMIFIPINAVAPSGIAKIQEATGSYGPALVGLGVICLIGGGLVLLMRERRGGSATTAEIEAAVEEAVRPAVQGM